MTREGGGGGWLGMLSIAPIVVAQLALDDAGHEPAGLTLQLAEEAQLLAALLAPGGELLLGLLTRAAATATGRIILLVFIFGLLSCVYAGCSRSRSIRCRSSTSTAATLL